MFIKESFQTSGGKNIEYAIDFPGKMEKEKEYPLIFYFHGMGMVNTSVENVMNSCPVRREYAEELPFIIFAPHCENFTWLEDIAAVKEFIDYIVLKPYCDADRVYLTGSSMGGYTCWLLSVSFPEKFAAAVICCGAGPYFAANRISFPVIAYHGKLDTVVLPRESEIMVEKINAGGGNAKLVLCDGIEHGVWGEAYTDIKTYKWLLSNKRNHLDKAAD